MMASHREREMAEWHVSKSARWYDGEMKCGIAIMMPIPNDGDMVRWIDILHTCCLDGKQAR